MEIMIEAKGRDTDTHAAIELSRGAWVAAAGAVVTVA